MGVELQEQKSRGVNCQSHAVAELSMMGSRDSRGFWCGSGDYVSTPKMDKAGRGWLQQLGGSAAPTQLLGVPQISRGQAGLVGGHTQVNFRTKLQGVGKLQVYKEVDRKEIGTGVNRSRNRKWSNQRYNSMEPQESGQAPMSQDN